MALTLTTHARFAVACRRAATVLRWAEFLLIFTFLLTEIICDSIPGVWTHHHLAEMTTQEQVSWVPAGCDAAVVAALLPLFSAMCS